MERTYCRQKKGGKGGFTLVELVVVIAILGILAAVAIPAVVNIVGTAGRKAEETEASSLNKACYEYYTEILSGTVNSSQPHNSTQTGLPGPKAGKSVREAAALNASVINACEYASLDKLKTRIQDGDQSFGYDSSGQVKVSDNTTTPITADTKLKDFMPLPS